MPKTILDLVREKQEHLAEAKPGNPIFDEAEEMAKLAARAITEGRFSLAWREYMLQFVDQDPFNPKQLARLLAEDGTVSDEKMNRRRAYLLGNAICGGPSPGNGGMLAFGVNGIDEGL